MTDTGVTITFNSGPMVGKQIKLPNDAPPRFFTLKELPVFYPAALPQVNEYTLVGPSRDNPNLFVYQLVDRDD